jgi:hypothetical protein
MKTIVCTAAIAVAVLLPSTIAVSAKPVMRGALEICEIIDGGTTQTGGMNGDIERCCARETSGSNTGRYYCVTCRPPGSQNCEEDYPNVRGTTVDNLPSAPLVPTTPLTGQSKP